MRERSGNDSGRCSELYSHTARPLFAFLNDTFLSNFSGITYDTVFPWIEQDKLAFLLSNRFYSPPRTQNINATFESKKKNIFSVR